MQLRTLLLVLTLALGANISYGFHIECPSDVTVNCDDELWDLSIYGTAYVYGYGSPVPASNPPYVSHFLNNCGTGYITRTWTAYDYSNNPHSCTQHIYVQGNGGSNISWPPNYETDDCYANLNPDALPAPYNRPILSNGPCSNLMVTHRDEVFNFGGCKKILREWKVIDWCIHNPNDPLWGGMWIHTQVIKIKPGNNSLQLHCPEDIEISAGAYCNGTYVHIPSVTATGACGGAINVTHNSPYASSQGNNASGHYPNGVTWITFRVDDPCSGAWKSCQMKVTIRDEKKPTPICFHGITINLMMNSDGYYMNLDAKWLDKGSFDNCTPKEYLKFRVEPNHFDCTTLGRQDVRMYVQDADGNEQYCNTYVIVQDNMGMCPPPDTTTYHVTGNVKSLSGQPLEDMGIAIKQGNDEITTTSSNSDGLFQINGLMNSQDYLIEPHANHDYKQGINVLDLLLMAKHVQQYSEFEEPYQYVTADVNHDGYVTAKDVVDVKNLLLNRRKELPGNVSWKFTTDDYSYEEIMDMAQNQNLVSNYFVEDLQHDMSNVNFRAIKMGDVDNSIEKNLNEREARKTTLWKTQTNSDDTRIIDVIATEESILQCTQFEIEVKHGLIQKLISGIIDIKGNYAIEDNDIAALIVHSNLRHTYLEAGDILFSVELDREDFAEQSLTLKESTDAVMYDDELQAYRIILDQDESSIVDENINEVIALKITPNPVGSARIVQFEASENIESVSIHTMNGILLERYENNSEKKTMVISLEQVVSGQMYMAQTLLDSGEIRYNKVLVIE